MTRRASQSPLADELARATTLGSLDAARLAARRGRVRATQLPEAELDDILERALTELPVCPRARVQRRVLDLSDTAALLRDADPSDIHDLVHQVQTGMTHIAFDLGEILRNTKEESDV